MKYNRLGYSGILVSDLCLGTMIFGETSKRGTSAAEAEKMVHRYLDAGGNHIDTANTYAGGESEKILGKALKGKRDEVILATKVNFSTGKHINSKGLSRRSILTEFEACLKRLQTDHVDILYMHCWDAITPIEESLRTFEDLVRVGKVRYIGVSNFKAWQLMKALGISGKYGWAKFIAAQYQYSLVKRDIEDEFTELCQSEGVGLTPWSPLGGGFLSGKYTKDQKPETGRIAMMPDSTEEAWIRRNTAQNWAILEVVDAISKDRNTSYAAVALAWLRAQPSVSSVIMGVRTMAQLEDNLKAADLNLTEEELGKLNSVSALPERYPYRFINNYGRK